MTNLAMAAPRPRRHYSIFTRNEWFILLLVILVFGASAIEPLLVARSFPATIELGRQDLGLAQGWSAKEWSDALPGANGPISASYRWSGPSSQLVFAPDEQAQAQLVTLSLLAGRPGGRAIVPVQLYANDHPLATISTGPTLRRYYVFVPGDYADGQSLALRLDTPAFRPSGDSDRLLGIIGLEARSTEVGGLPWRPRPTLALSILGLAALLLANGLSLRRSVFAAAAALAGALAAGLYAPSATLEAARTLFQLFIIAALIVCAARWWRHGRRTLRHPWRWAAALLVVLTVLAFTPSMSADGVEYYAYLRSLAVDHDLDFTNEYVGPDVPFERVPTALARNRSPTGYAQNLASVGPAIVWAPFYLVGDAIARLGVEWSAGWTIDGYSLPYLAMINLASTISLALTVWLCYLVARRVAGHGVALLAAASLVAGSAIVDYGLFEAHYPHALAATAVAAYFYWWLRTRPDRSARQWIVLGLLAGLIALMYWINGILMLLPALDLLPSFWHSLKERNWRAIGRLVGYGLLFLAATLLAFSPQMLAWKILYGSLFTIPHGASFAEPGGFKALEMIFSPEHGQLLWAPITVVGMVGMVWYIARKRWEGLLVLLVFALYFLYNATLGSWHGGGPFGLRRIANVLPLLVPGLACLLEWLAKRARMAALTICALCLTWNAALLLRFVSYLIPHHPEELGGLSIGEFVLAPNNLPWSKLGSTVSHALFPRLALQGLGSPSVGVWLSFGSLLGATVLICVAMVASIAWLHARLNREAVGGVAVVKVAYTGES